MWATPRQGLRRPRTSRLARFVAISAVTSRCQQVYCLIFLYVLQKVSRSVCYGRWTCRTKLGSKAVRVAFQNGFGIEWQLHSGRHEQATYQCGKVDLTGTRGVHDSERGSHLVEGWEDEDHHLPSERCVEDPSVGVEPTGFSGAGGAVSPHGLQLAEEGGQPAKPLKAPAKPTAEMIAMHEISHIPFRAWCPHCVRGRGKSFQHRRVDHSQDDKDHPVVSIDYAFFGAPGELPADAVGGQKMPVLVVRDRFTKSLFSHLVPAKGVEHFYPEAALLRDIKFLGYTKLTLKSDQEPSILALANAVRNTLSSQNIECQLESSPKGDAHGMSNGEAESSVGIAQGLTRTLKDHIEHKTGQLLDPKSPLLSWMIEYVGVLYTLFSYDEHSQDGITPFRKVKGRDWQLALPVFGECVDYRVKTVHKLEARWDSGIFLGIRLNTTEKIIGTPKGVVVVQSVRRKPEDQQWNAELIKSLVGTPWAPSPEKAKKPQEALELPEPVSIEAEQPSVEVDTSVAEMKPHYRRVYLLQPDFEKFGYSATCKACNALRLGFDRQGLNHSEECRLRIVQRLQETEYGRKRIEIARKREDEAKR